MRYKENVIVIFTPTVLHIIAMWEEACRDTISMQYEPMVTSGCDGTHSRHSGHLHGRALDFRLKDIPFELRQNLLTRAQERLGPKYLVLMKPTHYHVQRNRESFEDPAP